jgi:hypothetical protein
MKVQSLVVGALAALSLTIAPAEASAETHIPASLVAQVTIELHPKLCDKFLHGLNIVGYELAEDAFEASYGTGRDPSAAAVFHSIINQCRTKR